MFQCFLNNRISSNDFSYGKQSLKSTASRFLGMPFLKNELKNNFIIYLYPISALWPRGQVKDCKSFYVGSSPTGASKELKRFIWAGQHYYYHLPLRRTLQGLFRYSAYQKNWCCFVYFLCCFVYFLFFFVYLVCCFVYFIFLALRSVTIIFGICEFSTMLLKIPTRYRFRKSR